MRLVEKAGYFAPVKWLAGKGLSPKWPTVWVKKSPPTACIFSTFFDKRLRILNRFFTHLLYVPIYTRLQIFVQLSQTLRKLCHIKCDYLVHVICSKCPPSAETHAVRRLRKSLIALLIVVCGKSSQICCFCNVNKLVLCDIWNRSHDNDTVSGIAILDTTAIPEMRYTISMYFRNCQSHTVVITEKCLCTSVCTMTRL